MSRRTASAALAIAGVLVLTAGSAQAAPGDLDPSFGTGGKVVTAIGSGADVANGVSLQPDGKIVVAGRSSNGTDDDFELARYNTNGSLDTSFGSGGEVRTAIGPSDDAAKAVALQADGKIVAAGYTWNGTNDDIAVVRYNTDGSLDVSFGAGGIVTTPIGAGEDVANAVVLQTDGKIVAAGYSSNGTDNDFALVRYNADGSLDNTFNGTGKVTTPIGTGGDVAKAAALQADGKIVAAGDSSGSTDDFALARYNTDGTLDPTFGSGGTVTTPIGSGNDLANAVAIQSDGKILAVGETSNGANEDFALVRYNADASLDSGFGSGGTVTTAIGPGQDVANGVALQPDAKIVAAGYASNGTDNDFALARYTVNGALDSSFGSGGATTTSVGSGNDAADGVALQPDGRIVAAGYSNGDFALARYLAYAPDGSGTLSVSPTSVGAGASSTFTFTYTAAPGGTLNGELRLTVPSGWTAPQNSNPSGVGYVSTDAGTLSVSDRTIVVSSLTLAGGSTAHIVYGAATSPTTTGSSIFSAQEKSTASGTLADLGASPAVAVDPAGLNSFVVTAAGGGAIQTQTAGQSFDVKLTAEDQYGNTETDFGGTVAVSSNKTCSAGCGTSAAFSSGVLAGHAVTLTQAGSGATVTVIRSGGAESGTSSPFTVAPGAADHLTLTGSTANLVSGSSRTLSVEIEDAFENTADSTASVTFAKTGGVGTVTGLGSSSASGGTATRQVVGDKWGAVTIRASSSGVASDTIAFQVVPGAAKKLVFTMRATKLKVGDGALLAVEIRDANGNRVPDPVRRVTFAKASGAGRVLGLGKVRSEAGVAWALISGLKTGSIKLKATVPGLVQATVKIKIVK